MFSALGLRCGFDGVVLDDCGGTVTVEFDSICVDSGMFGVEDSISLVSGSLVVLSVVGVSVLLGVSDDSTDSLGGNFVIKYPFDSLNCRIGKPNLIFACKQISFFISYTRPICPCKPS